jgi:PKD repeat protein
MKRILLLGMLGICCATVVAQQGKPKAQEVCATMEQDSISRARFPQRGSLDDFEDAIQRRLAEIVKLNKSGRTEATIISIPIIVHVVHNGESVGTGMNISKEQVASQIAVLNEDFRRVAGTPGFNDDPVGADIEIEFCLSPVDENGKTMAEPGIHRYNGNQSDWSRDQIENKLKPTTIWNPNLFYNVWTVKFAAADNNLLGYAQFPDNSGLAGLQEIGGPSSTDGVVIRYQSFGSAAKGTFPVMQAPYNKGRTLTHETGHWLGLRHIWGDGNCANDFVADTPPQASASSGCQLGRVSCGGVNMVQNYMDYSEDACMNIFTQGQKSRIRAVMDISPRRKSLIQANLCSPPVAGPPIANFTVDKIDCILLGSEITFTDLSSNFPTEWQWEFEGGDPSTSNVRNPKVKYNTPGSFDVKLTVKNSLGTSAPYIIKDLIVVSEEGLCGEFTNFKTGYTPSLLPLSAFGTYTGLLTGQNSAGSQAFSEFFLNNCGYKYVSGVKVKFGGLSFTAEDAKVYVTVWNARGPQSSPGSVIERKEVLLKQIQADINQSKATEITFDRETPVFSKPFHVGVEIEYNKGYVIGVISSANGEATNATSWVKESSGQWKPFTIEFGANIAMDIRPSVGVNPSVQVSASQQIVYPGEEVTLNGHGASIFVWSASNGTIQNVPGPQLIVNPFSTTTYTTVGSGLDLCKSTTSTTIYVREQGVLGVEDFGTVKGVNFYPNPGSNSLTVEIDNDYLGEIEVKVESIHGQHVLSSTAEKLQGKFSANLNTTGLSTGIYLLRIKAGGNTVIKKWMKK